MRMTSYTGTRGIQYVMKTHSQLRPQTREDSILYTIQKIKVWPFKWYITPLFYLCNLLSYMLLKTHTHMHCIYFFRIAKKHFN